MGGSGDVRVDDTTQREQTYELDLQEGDTVETVAGIRKGLVEKLLYLMRSKKFSQTSSKQSRRLSVQSQVTVFMNSW